MTFELSMVREDAAGVYQLWRADNCMYVGQTANIFNRIGNHWGKDWDRIVFQREINLQQRLNLEEQLIRALRPAWNIQKVEDGGLRDKRLRPRGLRGRVTFSAGLAR